MTKIRLNLHGFNVFLFLCCGKYILELYDTATDEELLIIIVYWFIVSYVLTTTLGLLMHFFLHDIMVRLTRKEPHLTRELQAITMQELISHAKMVRKKKALAMFLLTFNHFA